MPRFIGIIPARYGSSRFPGKPLADLNGKTMIQRVYERACGCFEDIIVATDDAQIEKTVKDFGGQALLTSTEHRSGTDRCYEALRKYQESTGKRFEVVVNIQGDEPFIRAEQIESLKSCFEDAETQIATLIKTIDAEPVIHDPNRPKVVTDRNGFALYFSRSPIPFGREADPGAWHKKHVYYQHLGMYAYRDDVLKEITRLQPSALEMAESLEQLRWLENGFRIKTVITSYESFGIDTPKDLQNALKSGTI